MTLRRSHQNLNEVLVCQLSKSNALHFVSAWATKHGVALGQTQVGSKTNEITAIDELLDLIDVRGTTIALDVIGTQKTIAKKNTDKQGDYIFAIKNNHPKLADAIREHFESFHEHGLRKRGVKKRFYAVCAIPAALRSMTQAWAGHSLIDEEEVR